MGSYEERHEGVNLACKPSEDQFSSFYTIQPNTTLQNPQTNASMASQEQEMKEVQPGSSVRSWNP